MAENEREIARFDRLPSEDDLRSDGSTSTVASLSGPGRVVSEVFAPSRPDLEAQQQQWEVSTASSFASGMTNETMFLDAHSQEAEIFLADVNRMEEELAEEREKALRYQSQIREVQRQLEQTGFERDNIIELKEEQKEELDSLRMQCASVGGLDASLKTAIREIDRLKKLQVKVDPTERDSELEGMQLKVQAQDLEIRLLRDQVHDEQADKERIREELEVELYKMAEDAKADAEELQIEREKIKDKDKRLERLLVGAKQEIERVNEQANREKSDQRRRDNAKLEETKMLKAEIKTLQAHLNNSERRIEETAHTHEDHHGAIDRLRAELETAQADVHQCNERYEEMKQNHAVAEEKLEADKKSITAAMAEVQNQSQMKRAELDAIIERLEEELKAQGDQVDKTMEEKNRVEKQYQLQVTRLQREVEEAKLDVTKSSASDNSDGLKANAQELQLLKVEHQTSVQRLKGDLERETSRVQEAEKEILRLKDKHRLDLDQMKLDFELENILGPTDTVVEGGAVHIEKQPTKQVQEMKERLQSEHADIVEGLKKELEARTILAEDAKAEIIRTKEEYQLTVMQLQEKVQKVQAEAALKLENVQKMREETEALQQKLSAKKTPRSKEATVQTENDDIPPLESEVKGLRQKIEQSMLVAKQAHDEKQWLQARLKVFEEESKMLQTRLRVQEREVDLQIQRAQTNSSNAIAESTRLKQMMVGMQADNRRKAQEIESAKGKLSGLRKRHAEKAADADTLMEKLSASEAKVKLLQEELAHVKNSKQDNHRTERGDSQDTFASNEPGSNNRIESSSNVSVTASSRSTKPSTQIPSSPPETPKRSGSRPPKPDEEKIAALKTAAPRIVLKHSDSKNSLESFGKHIHEWPHSWHENDGKSAYGGRNVVGYGNSPPQPMLPQMAKVAINFVLHYEEGGEMCLLHGDTISENAPTEIVGAESLRNQRNMNVESLFEYGSRAGFWRVHRLFTGKNIPCTVFAVGMALERNKDVALAMKEAGWEISSHGYRLMDYRNADEATEKEHISRTIKSHQNVVGRAPLGIAIGNPSAKTRGIVSRHFYYDSDSYSDEVPFWTRKNGSPHLVIPQSLSLNDVSLVTGGGFANGQQFSRHLCETLDTYILEGKSGRPKVMTIGLHSRIIGRPGRAAGLAQFMEYAKSLGSDVWICTREDLARYWYDNYFPTRSSGTKKSKA